jgi:sulfite reductase (NADPH) flavoprotein alpha-component
MSRLPRTLSRAVRLVPSDAWVDDGAAIYVCGSLQGMAGGVDAALQDILGDARLQAMQRDGRYRRDVY